MTFQKMMVLGAVVCVLLIYGSCARFNVTYHNDINSCGKHYFAARRFNVTIVYVSKDVYDLLGFPKSLLPCASLSSIEFGHPMLIHLMDENHMQARLNVSCLKTIGEEDQKKQLRLSHSHFEEVHWRQGSAFVSILSYPILASCQEMALDVPAFVQGGRFPMTPKNFREWTSVLMATLKLMPQHIHYAREIFSKWLFTQEIVDAFNTMPAPHIEHVCSLAWSLVAERQLQDQPIIHVLFHRLFVLTPGECKPPSLSYLKEKAPGFLKDFILSPKFITLLQTPGYVRHREWLDALEIVVYQASRGHWPDLEHLESYLKTATLQGVSKRVASLLALKEACSIGGVYFPELDINEWKYTANLIPIMEILFRSDPNEFVHAFISLIRVPTMGSNSMLSYLLQEAPYMQLMHDPSMAGKLLPPGHTLPLSSIPAIDFFMGILSHDKLFNQMENNFFVIFDYLLPPLEVWYPSFANQALYLMMTPFYNVFQFWLRHQMTFAAHSALPSSLMTSYLSLTNPDYRILPIILKALEGLSIDEVDSFLPVRSPYQACLLGAVKHSHISFTLPYQGTKNRFDVMSLPSACLLSHPVETARSLAYLYYSIPFSMSRHLKLLTSDHWSLQSIISHIVNQVNDRMLGERESRPAIDVVTIFEHNINTQISLDQ